MAMNGTAAAEWCDVLDVARFANYIMPPSGVVEVRVLGARSSEADDWPKELTGFFSDVDKLTAEVRQIRHADGIYITLNEVDPALLARSANRIRKAGKNSATSDTNIARRRFLLIDADPNRPAGVSSTHDEHCAAEDLAEEIELHLHDLGWPDPIRADSGNGWHLLYAIDLPADDGGLVERVLAALADRFDTPDVSIDRKVFNPSRISKLYGTMARKGDDTADRPHRISRMVAVPDTLQPVPRALLEELAGPVPAPREQHNGHASNGAAFDVQAFIDRNGFDVDGPHQFSGRQGAGLKWTFRTSPMCDHHDDGPFIVQHASGAISAECHHNSCGWKWEHLRALFEPKQERTFNGGDRWTTNAPTPEQAASRPNRFKAITAAELDATTFDVQWLVDWMLVDGQPCILAGGKKCLKTTEAVDLGISIATGGMFLGEYQVRTAKRFLLCSGESGAATLQETSRRVAASKGWRLADVEKFSISEELPRLDSIADLAAWELFIVDHGAEVVCVDPAFLCMPGDGADNLFKTGELLARFSETCRRHKITPILAHHTKKNRAGDLTTFDPPELEDIAWAGFQEFARQWLLVGRRERYISGTGEHRLWFNYGGSVGHGGLLALDVNEGVISDPQGRFYEASVAKPSEARDDAEQRRADAKAQRLAQQLEGDVRKIVNALAGMPEERGTKTDLRDRTALNQSRFAPALADALAAKHVLPTTITKANKQTYDGFQLNHPD